MLYSSLTDFNLLLRTRCPRYLNYDCDEFLNNLFERLVNDVSRVSQGRASSELGGTPQQELEMKVSPYHRPYGPSGPSGPCDPSNPYHQHCDPHGSYDQE